MCTKSNGMWHHAITDFSRQNPNFHEKPRSKHSANHVDLVCARLEMYTYAPIPVGAPHTIIALPHTSASESPYKTQIAFFK